MLTSMRSMMIITAAGVVVVDIVDSDIADSDIADTILNVAADNRC